MRTRTARGRLLALPAAVIAWMLCAPARPAAADAPVRIGVDVSDAADWSAFETFLNGELARRSSSVRVQLVPLTQDEILWGVGSEEPTLAGAVLSPLRYVTAAVALGDLRVLARMRRSASHRVQRPASVLELERELPGPRETYRSLVAMRRKAGVGTWPPKPGSARKFGFLSRRSTSSFLFPMTLFRDRGWIENGAVQPVGPAGADDELWQVVPPAPAQPPADAAPRRTVTDLFRGLREGDFDLIGFNDDWWDRYIAHSASAADRLAVAIVHESAPIVFDPLVIRPGVLGEADLQALRTALLSTDTVSAEVRDHIFPWHVVTESGGLKRALPRTEQVPQGTEIRRSPQIHDWIEASPGDYDEVRRAAVTASAGGSMRLVVSEGVHPRWESDKPYYDALAHELMRGGESGHRVVLGIEVRSSERMEETYQDLLAGRLDVAELNAHYAAEAVGRGLPVIATARFAGPVDETHHQFVIVTSAASEALDAIDDSAAFAFTSRDAAAGYRWPVKWLEDTVGALRQDQLVECGDAYGVLHALLGEDGSTAPAATYGFLADHEWEDARKGVLTSLQERRLRLLGDARGAVPNAVLVASREFCPRLWRWQLLDGAPPTSWKDWLDLRAQRTRPDPGKNVEVLRSFRAALRKGTVADPGVRFRGYADAGKDQWHELVGVYEKFHRSPAIYVLVAFAVVAITTAGGLFYRARVSRSEPQVAAPAGPPPGAPSVFLSYRRKDSQFAVPLVLQELARNFVVLHDGQIVPGEDFRKRLDMMIAGCSAVVALVGDRWSSASDEKGRRLDNPDDFVRIEIESALARDIPLVPLVLGASMPAERDLPASIAPFAYRNAIVVPSGRDLTPALTQLTGALLRVKEGPGAAKAPRVFVSRSPADAAFVQSVLAPLLARNAIGCWYWREEISSPSEWQALVLAALEESDWCVFVLSRASVASTWVRAEAAWALRHRPDRILLLRVEAVEARELNEGLAGLTPIDYPSDPEAAARVLVRRISRVVGQGGGTAKT